VLDVETVEAAYWSHRGPAPLMPSSHRHDDLEINLVLDGRLDYRFGGAPVSVHAGEIALFWGWTPHQLVGDGTGRGEFRWVHIPLAEVLAWGLPDHDLGAMLLNRPVVVPTHAAGRDVESMLGSWQRDFADGWRARHRGRHAPRHRHGAVRRRPLP